MSAYILKQKITLTTKLFSIKLSTLARLECKLTQILIKNGDPAKNSLTQSPTYHSRFEGGWKIEDEDGLPQKLG